MLQFASTIIIECISADLRDNQQAIGQCVMVTLGVCESLDERQMTSIGNVRSIGCHSIINAGTRISNHANIGNGVIVEEACSIETGAVIGDQTLVEFGVKIRVGAVVGPRCILETQAEVSYDVLLGSDEKIGPSTVMY